MKRKGRPSSNASKLECTKKIKQLIGDCIEKYERGIAPDNTKTLLVFIYHSTNDPMMRKTAYMIPTEEFTKVFPLILDVIPKINGKSKEMERLKMNVKTARIIDLVDYLLGELHNPNEPYYINSHIANNDYGVENFDELRSKFYTYQVSPNLLNDLGNNRLVKSIVSLYT